MWHRGNGLHINTVFNLNRLWLWSPEVSGATFDLFTWNHDVQGDCDATAALRNGQDWSNDGPGPAQGIVVRNPPPTLWQRRKLVFRMFQIREACPKAAWKTADLFILSLGCPVGTVGITIIVAPNDT